MPLHDKCIFHIKSNMEILVLFSKLLSRTVKQCFALLFPQCAGCVGKIAKLMQEIKQSLGNVKLYVQQKSEQAH